MPKPTAKKAAEPAKDLSSLNGNAFPFPSLRPTMSAMPSPPHISASAAIPYGEPLQYSAVVITSTSV